MDAKLGLVVPWAVQAAIIKVEAHWYGGVKVAAIFVKSGRHRILIPPCRPNKSPETTPVLSGDGELMGRGRGRREGAGKKSGFSFE